MILRKLKNSCQLYRFTCVSVLFVPGSSSSFEKYGLSYQKRVSNLFHLRLRFEQEFLLDEWLYFRMVIGYLVEQLPLTREESCSLHLRLTLFWLLKLVCRAELGDLRPHELRTKKFQLSVGDSFLPFIVHTKSATPQCNGCESDGDY